MHLEDGHLTRDPLKENRVNHGGHADVLLSLSDRIKELEATSLRIAIERPRSVGGASKSSRVSIEYP